MTYSVYVPNEEISITLGRTRDHSLPFEFINENFNIVDNVSDADIIPVLTVSSNELHKVDEMVSYLGGNLKDKIILIMLHTHIQNDDFHEHSTKYLIDKWSTYSNKVAIVSLDYKTSRDIFYDFCWNRQKAYFVDYDKHDLYFRLWTGHATKNMFELGDIVKRGPYKKFLVPNRVHANREDQHRNILRQRLHDFVLDRFCHRGNPEAGYVLYSQENTRDLYYSVEYSHGGWSPISDDYYQTSFVSLFVETVTSAKNMGCISEKTYDPLIKGHFILPYGFYGMIRDIKNMGFLLPEWIDYSYDIIPDAEERFQSYLISISELNKLSEFDMLELFNKDKDMLIHNRELFWKRPYDSLSNKITQRFLPDSPQLP
jgi:hypothetical protein